MAARAWIGTSGWSYDHWREGVFYPADLKRGGELAYYANAFDCVEINSSFYHTPRETTLEKWRDTTPDGFLFAYKATRSITHNHKLHDVGETVEFVLGRARILGPKLGPILWQFSPSWQRNLERLRDFLELLPKDLRHAFEFRHESWFCDETYELLGEHDAALVWADTPRYPLVKKYTANFIYIRLHGHEALYLSNYPEHELARWASEVQEALRESKDVYLFFDNDASGYAVANALTLRSLL